MTNITAALNNHKIALWAFFAQSIHLLSGPIVIFLVSSRLSLEELSFYYSFLSMIALQQIAEMGIGFTIKQYIAHVFRYEDDGNVGAAKEIKSLAVFSILWFLGVSFFVVACVGYLGSLFFSSYSGDLNWQVPWWTLVVSLSLSILFTPLVIVAEGCQFQAEVYRARLLCALFNVITLFLCIMADFGLLSLSIAMIASNVIMYLSLGGVTCYLYKKFSIITITFNDIKETGKTIWPMLSKISLTWILGYFFWNSFNLIAFKNMDINEAGKFSFTLALAKAGYSLVDSVMNGQTTVYSRMIASGDLSQAKTRFSRYFNFSFLVLIFGYLSFFILNYVHADFFLFDKVLSSREYLPMFLYFTLLFPVNAQANFCRCFKDEPYFYLSLFCNITVPLIFFIMTNTGKESPFLYLMPISIMLIFWSFFIYRKFVK